MHSKENWDDLRFVLAVAGAGSVSGAARQLGVNHATVLRRIAAFEDRFDVVIFDKTARGYAISGDRLRVIDAAREVQTAIETVTRIIQGAQAPLRGVVRVTSTDTFCNAILPPVIARLPDQASGLRIELMSTNAHLDLSRLHADITVRPAQKLGDGLTGKVAAQLGFDIYAAPQTGDDTWLGLSGALENSLVATWMSSHMHPDNFAGAADSFITLRELAALGLGQVVLPCVLGDTDPRLERRHGIMPDTSVDIWVATHTDLVDVPRIHAVSRLLIRALSDKSEELAGRQH